MICSYCYNIVLSDISNRPRYLIDVHKNEMINTESICSDCYDSKKICVITHVWGNYDKYYFNHIKGLTWAVYLSDKEKLDNIISGCSKISNIQWCWLDCVCINQDNEKEKIEEISKMFYIYKNSEYCALYRDSFTDKRAIELKDDLNKINWDLPLNSDDNHFIICQCLPGNACLTSCEWAERFWTIQEAILPKNLLIITKNHIIDLSSVFNLLSIAYKWPYFKESFKDYIHSNISKLFFYIRNDENIDYASIINIMGNRVSKYIHDRIYGIMGILSTNIEVDYNCAPDVVVNRFIDELIKKNDWSWLGCLDSVNHIHGHSLEPNIMTNKSILIKSHDLISINKINAYYYDGVNSVIHNISDINVFRTALLTVNAILYAMYGWCDSAKVYIKNVEYNITIKECFDYLITISHFIKRIFNDGKLDLNDETLINELKSNLSPPTWYLIYLSHQLSTFNPCLVKMQDNYLFIGVGHIIEQDSIFMTNIISEHGRMLMVSDDNHILKRKGWLIGEVESNESFTLYNVN
jgi:hypothetical protein